MEPSSAIALVIHYLITFLARFVHPSELNMDKFTNNLYTMRFTNLKVLRMESKTVS